MRYNTLPFALVAALGLAACGGENAGTDNNSTESTSPHSQAPTANSAAAAEDEPVPAGTPAVSEALDVEDDSAEEAAAEDPTSAGDAANKSSDGVAQSENALSTSYGTTFDLTYYWVANRPSGDPNQVTLRDCGGNFLTYASYAWRDAVRMEMTGRFKKSDGTVVTFNDANGCWKKMSSYYDWGMGVPSPVTGKSYKLRPFRSIAVDKSVLSIGKWYYIKQLDGVQMPSPRSTTIHDGCVRAVDQGYGIWGRHIDFFVGLKSAYGKLVNGSSTMGGRSTITVYDGSAKCGIHIARGY